jgi:hypothetical protein
MLNPPILSHLALSVADQKKIYLLLPVDFLAHFKDSAAMEAS